MPSAQTLVHGTVCLSIFFPSGFALIDFHVSIALLDVCLFYVRIGFRHQCTFSGVMTCLDISLFEDFT